eukprot:sb/3475843/
MVSLMKEQMILLVVVLLGVVQAEELLITDKLYEGPCLRSCAGVVNDPNWVAGTATSLVVDIEGCGFIATPVVTASLSSESQWGTKAGTVGFVHVTWFKFEVQGLAPGDNGYTVQWTAMGPTC